MVTDHKDIYYLIMIYMELDSYTHTLIYLYIDSTRGL